MAVCHKPRMSVSLSAKQQQCQLAEQSALVFLQARDPQLIDRNACFSVSEMDLNQRDANNLVFIDDRQHKSTAISNVMQSIDNRKMKKCALAAQCWLKMHPQCKNASCRFDAVLLTGSENDWQIQWLENAFVFQEMF